jgi:malonyl-CoA O-methyltransferase
LDPRYLLSRSAIRRNFERAASGFAAADFVHTVTRQGLFERLEAMLIKPRQVLDLGCATGKALPLLAKRFPKARIIGVDQSRGMLREARKGRRWLSRIELVQCDARELPFSDHSVDVVFSNLLLPWFDEPSIVAAEIRRVLHKDGVFIFSALGPDTFQELRAAWAGIDERAHVHRFPDMHELGDALVRAGLRDPVLDVDRLQVTYPDSAALFRDLTAAAARNCLASRGHGLTGKDAFAGMARNLQAPDDNREVRIALELVYGHCFGAGPASSAGPVRIDPAAIPIRRR